MKLLSSLLLLILISTTAFAEVSNPVNGTVTESIDGTITFVPDPDFHGEASFDYTITDGKGGSAWATAYIEILSVNDPPVAIDFYTVAGQEDLPLNITHIELLENASDPDGDELRLSNEADLLGCNSGMLWVGDAERGLFTVNRMEHGFRRSINSGYHRSRVVEDPVHSGNYAYQITIDTINGLAGARKTVSNILGDQGLYETAYYSVWYKFPEVDSIPGQWSIMGWPGITDGGEAGVGFAMTHSIDVISSSQNVLMFAVHEAGGSNIAASMPFVSTEWVHLECKYKYSLNATGQIKCWVNNVEAWDIQNIITQKSGGYAWMVQSTATKLGVVPNRVTMQIDDAVISNKRIGNKCFN